eukprot:gene33569-43153_t
MAEQFTVCFDGATHKKTDVEKEASNLINVQEVVAFMREAKYCTELISRRYEDKHLHRVLTERNADLRGLTTKIKKLERLIQLLKAEDAGAEAPAAAARKKRRGGKQQKRQKQPSNSDGTDDSDDESSSGLDECLADRKMRVAPQKENLLDDYAFEDMTPGSFAVTVAGGEDTDKCWFD